ncbi:hypothetical protein [Ruminococcus albus]|uniref:hypothetical protein n=1 Tax=Ruminococcus albus TaxID=1264 RepID=UPI001D144373|nr:hypothetical protein [Ruminococcus albus]MCC3351694.1 hypothetical protein [Ruminococcus albus 8]
MTYITGDTHGFYDDTLDRFAGAGVKEGDKVIICGDFGFVWSVGSESEINLKKLAKEKFTILFVDGTTKTSTCWNVTLWWTTAAERRTRSLIISTTLCAGRCLR